MIDAKFKLMFFDSEGVKRKVKDGTKSALSKYGSFVRTDARRSIRKGPRKKAYKAVPGSPPRSWQGNLRDLIFFGYDTSTESVVVGPALFKQASPTAPHLLEFGGTGVYQGHAAYYHKFPFMNPAMARTLSKMPSMFNGAVKG